MTRKTKIYLGAASALAMTLSLACAGGAAAQGATTTLRGTIYEGQTVEPGGAITATEVATGYVARASVGADGRYVFVGLRPGTYRIQVSTADGQTAEDTLTLGLGQVGTLDLNVGAPGATAEADATNVGDVVVVGRRVFEVRTPEVATNVTQQQINNLPQINRNFLNFAALAPGLRVTEGETERTISAGGQTAQSINVFIDGQNQKSTIIDGGVAGQDDSRGNPFPQAAVQEFRVISQNFKAEYEQAGSAIITAVTRSGTNEFHGEIFGSYQNQDWIAQNVFSERRGEEKPELKRIQYGIALGGPIIQDRLHFFGSYERKDETRAAQTFLNRTEYEPLFRDELGTFGTPFEEDLYFGKLSWQIDDRQRLDISAQYRTEEDIRDVGNQNGPERATSIQGETKSLNIRHQFQGDGFLNELSLDYFQYGYRSAAENFGSYGREYVVFRDNSAATPGFQYNVNNRDTTVFITGGRSDNQYNEQTNYTIRDDLTLTDIEWMGLHTVKMGAKYSRQEYYLERFFGRNPQFFYDIDGRPEINGNRDIPVQVNLGAPLAPVNATNNVIGLYIQDDWQITDKLELNIGIRWDYESNAFNNKYETPEVIRNLLTALENAPGYNFPSYFNPADYISNGKRDPFMGAFQPRIGFSYDLYGDERTVLFGGAGRYYDRLGFIFSVDERFKPTQFNRTIYFSEDGAPVQTGSNPDGSPVFAQTILWNPAYLTPEGLDPLLAASQGRGEVFLINNNAEPPFTDQFNIGVRQKLGVFQTALTFAFGHTENESGWYKANVLNPANGTALGPTPTSVGFPQFSDTVFFQNQDKERDFKAIYLTIDKPYNQDDRWGLNVAYTYMDATQNGSRSDGTVAFDFDYPIPGMGPEYPSSTDEQHRIVASGTVGLPYDFLLSGIVTLGSGVPYNITDGCPGAYQPGPTYCWNGGRPDKKDFILPNAFAYRQVDLRLTKRFEVFNGDAIELSFDAINVFNFKNYSSFEQNYNSPNFGNPTAQYLPTRSFQVGLRYSW